MEHISAAIYKIISALLSMMITAGIITAPASSSPITADEGTNLSFVALGDTQVCNYNIEREKFLVSATEDFKQAVNKPDALVIAGDITENGFQEEYDLVYDQLSASTIENFVFSAGNHDIRLREYDVSMERFLAFSNSLNTAENAIDKIYAKVIVNGYTFLTIGSDEMRFEDAYISTTQLQWLDSELKAATESGKPVFVIGHYPLKNTHGLPDTWSNSLWESGSIGDQSEQVQEILARYENVFFITGHLHTGFGQYTYQNVDGINCVNLPSIGIENKDGDYNNQGIGFLVKVSSDRVAFAARNFATGENLPAYDIVIDLV